MIARDLRVIFLSASMGSITCVLVAAVLSLDRKALADDPAGFLLMVVQLGFFMAVMFGAPLGAVGGLVAVWQLRRRPDFTPSRWPGRAAIVGATIGAVGSASPFLISRSFAGAAVYALVGSIAGAFAGVATAVVLRRVLGRG